MGFVALTGNAMFGMHSDVRRDAGILAIELYDFMQARGVGGGAIVALYGCGNWEVRYGGSNRKWDWEGEIRHIAKAFSFHGPARGFDTSIIAPHDGTYVEYLPLYPQQQCRIFYKRNEKMDYTNTDRTPTTGFNPDIKKLGAYGRIMNVSTETTAGNVIQTFGNKGNLHEVDYGTRLFNFVV